MYDGGVPIIRNQNAFLQYFNASYTDSRFTGKSRTIYIKAGIQEKKGDTIDIVVEGAVYNYDDRLQSWIGYDKYQAAWNKTAEELGGNITAARVERSLQIALDNPKLELVQIIVSVNQMNGYAYQAYGYFEHKEE